MNFEDSTGRPSGTRRCPACFARLPVESARGICIRCALVDFDTEPFLEGEIPAVGKKLGSYQLLEEIGRGATGIVFRARQAGLDREVAVKVLRLGPLANTGDMSRFRREAVAAARLKHPNIVPVFGFEDAAGWMFLVLGLVKGRNLALRLDDGRPTPRTAARWIRDAADALAHAHARNVVHRDLKPGNVLLDGNDEVHLTDFGLAKLADLESELTRSGEIVGTIAYFAPEQAEGSQQEDARSDIYALGAILYHCLTGAPPFGRLEPAAMLRAIVDEDPVEPTKHAPWIPKDLETICLKCLSKSPSGRYATAHLLRADLDRFLRDEPITARKTNLIGRFFHWGRRNPLVASLSATMALIVATTFGIVDFAWRRAEREAKTSHDLLTHQFVARGFASIEQLDFSAALPWFVRAWTHENPPTGTAADDIHRLRLASTLARAPRLEAVIRTDSTDTAVAMSPDGRALAVGDVLGKLSLWNSESGEPIGVPTKLGLRISSIAWRPDGEQIAVALGNNHAGGGLAFLNTHSRAVEWRTDSSNAQTRVAYSPDGQFVATGSTVGELEIRSSVHFQKLGLTMRHDGSISALQFNPRGDRLLTGSWDESAAIWSWRDSLRLVEVKHAGFIRDAKFSPAGDLFATASDDGTARVWQVESGAPVGPPLQHRARVYCLAFGPDGRSLVSGGHDGIAHIWDASTGLQIGSPLGNRGGIRRLAFSPDGKSILVGTSDGVVSTWNSESGRAEGLSLNLKPTISYLSWSHDGRSFVVADDSGLVRRWARPPNSTAQAELSVSSTPNKVVASPDGQTILVVLDSPKALLWKWNTPASKPLELPHGQVVLDSGFSADGTKCFTVSEDGTARIWSATTAAALSEPLNSGGRLRCGAFSPDGKALATAGDSGTFRIWRNTLLRPEFTECPIPGRARDLKFSADGRIIAVASDQVESTAPHAEISSLTLWDVRGQPEKTRQYNLKGRVNQMQLSQDGRSLIVAAQDGRVLVYAADGGLEPVFTLNHGCEVLSVALHPENRLLLTGDLVGTGRIWDLETHRILGTFCSQHGRRLSWSEGDARWIVSASRDLTAGIWDASTFDLVLPPFEHNGPIRSGTLDSGRNFFATSAVDKKVRVWALEIPKGSRGSLVRQAQLVFDQAVGPEGRLEPLSTDEYLGLWAEEWAARNRK